MLAVQVNTLRGCVVQLFGRIYYALGEIKAIDCLQQGHNKVSFSTERGLSPVATTLGHHLATRRNKVNQICWKKLWTVSRPPRIQSDNGLYLYEGISYSYIIHGAVENAMAVLI